MSARDMPMIEAALRGSATRWVFFTPRELSEGWRSAFGDAAACVPQPFWLFADDEQTPLVLGFPVRTTGAWEAFLQALATMVTCEANQSGVGVVTDLTPSTAEARSAVVRRLSPMIENALASSHGRRFAETLWLAVSREAARHIGDAVNARMAAQGGISPELHELRYALARRIADVAQRAEAEALRRLRTSEAAEIDPDALAFSRLLRDDLMPFAERRLTADLIQLDAYVRGAHHIEPERFRRVLHELIERVERLLQRDAGFAAALRALDPESGKLTPEARVFTTALLDLLEIWPAAETPRPDAGTAALLREMGPVLRRFEVLVALRERIFPVSVSGTRTTTVLRKQSVGLSVFTRPLDFTSPGVVDSAVRRFGLLYDLVEFTSLLEALRRQGRAAEERALQLMGAFHREIDAIRGRHRLRFEKFLGDGAFFTSRRALPLLRGAAELRSLYETMRQRGFPFDRGLRIAVNVGTYHLLPMPREDRGGLHFEFFGHSLVELARLTTGKRSQDADEVADFLIASGYDVHRVLEFLEPVRHAPPPPDPLKSRPYAAHVAENGELVNHGIVVTEAFLHDLEREWEGRAVRETTLWGTRWVLLQIGQEDEPGQLVAVRYLGTGRLKGLEPLQLAEMAVLDTPPADVRALPPGTSIVQQLHASAGREEEPPGNEQEDATPPRLCIASVLENPQVRAWFLGLWDDEHDALANAFHVPIQTVELKDGEPFELWLFRRRAELTMLYQGLRRHGDGTGVPLASLRERDGYFTCLLAAPHRSPR